MKNTIFTGAAVAIITPMNADGSINYDELGRVIDDQIAKGTDAIVICGTTGESATMTDDEHRDCIKFAVKHTAGRVPVIAGAGSNDTHYAVELSKEAEAAGADALLHVTPYYNKATQKGLIAHFTAIADAVNIPIILYNVPSRTGCGFDVATVKELSKHRNIAAIKEASGNISYVAKLAAACGDDIDIYSGNDDMVQLCLDNNFTEAMKLQLKYLDIINDLFIEVNPIPVKEAMNMVGWNAGPCRLPLCEMTDEHKAKLQATLAKHGLIK